MKSTHRVDVTRVLEIIPHSNADALEIAKIFGFTCSVAKGQFKEGDLIAYVPPDSLVDTNRPEFAFLASAARGDGLARIRVKKLRGIASQGLVLPVQSSWTEGMDVAEALGVIHYEPPISISTGGEAAPSPSIYTPTYTDIENLRRYPNVFSPGEPVIITEKIHGTSGRFVYCDDSLHVGSHREWKRESVENVWWRAAREFDLKEKLRPHPGLILYGEVYGWVQDLRYGMKRSDPPQIAFFDVMRDGVYLDWEVASAILDALDLPAVPVVYEGSWVPDLVEFAEGQSLRSGAGHIREGIVVRATTEGFDPVVGRRVLKCVGNEYLSRN